MAELESSDILWNLHQLKPAPWHFEIHLCGLDFEIHDVGLAGRNELLV